MKMLLPSNKAILVRSIDLGRMSFVELVRRVVESSEPEKFGFFFFKYISKSRGNFSFPTNLPRGVNLMLFILEL